MYILNRRCGERIVIETPAGTVTVEVFQIRRRSNGDLNVWLGFEADRSIRIERDDMKQPALKTAKE